MSGQRRALVVAIDRYAHPMLRKLAAPTADAAALARVLGESDLGGFDVEVLTDASSYEVTQAVEALLGEAKSSDLVLLHFSCHGIKDDSGELFLAASNTVPNRLVSTAVEAAMVSRLIQRSRAQRVVLLLDCCYGGAFERGVVARAAGEVDVAAQFAQQSPGGGRGRVVITASSAMEYAFEGTTLTDSSGPTPSLFTGALVEGITSGEADRDQDGQVGLDELYDYIHTKVQERTPNQTPSKWEFGVQGDLYIARNPRRRILPAQLPDELLELVAHPAASVRLASVGDLDQLAGGHNLRLAAGARLALEELRDDDSRRVSAAAISALERTALRISPIQVDWGQSPTGSGPRVEVRVEGGPLAQASSIEVTREDLHARVADSVLTVTTTTDAPEPPPGQVRLSGPAGEAILQITGAVADVSDREDQTRGAEPAEQPPETDHAAQVTEEGVDSLVEVPTTKSLDTIEQEAGDPESPTLSDHEVTSPGGQATKPQLWRRLPVRVLVAAGVVLVLGATLIAVLVTRSTAAPAPFQSAAQYDFARYLFDADECSPGTAENAPVAYFLPHSELVKCDSRDQPYEGTFLCTNSDQDLLDNRVAFRSYAIGGTERQVPGSPAGKNEAVDGVQVAFNHVNSNDARVYWDSPSQRCAGELQADSDDVDAAIDYWHNGTSS